MAGESHAALLAHWEQRGAVAPGHVVRLAARRIGNDGRRRVEGYFYCACGFRGLGESAFEKPDGHSPLYHGQPRNYNPPYLSQITIDIYARLEYGRFKTDFPPVTWASSGCVDKRGPRHGRSFGRKA